MTTAPRYNVLIVHTGDQGQAIGTTVYRRNQTEYNAGRQAAKGEASGITMRIVRCN